MTEGCSKLKRSVDMIYEKQFFCIYTLVLNSYCKTVAGNRMPVFVDPNTTPATRLVSIQQAGAVNGSSETDFKCPATDVQ